MKKTVSVIAIIFAVALLAGCGRQQTSQTQPTTSTPKAQQKEETIKTSAYEESIQVRDNDGNLSNFIIVRDSTPLYGVIDINKKEILPMKYKEIFSDGNNFIATEATDLFTSGLFNKDGQQIISFGKYQSLSFAGENLIAKVNEKYGVIDKQEKIFIPFNYDALMFDAYSSNFFIAGVNQKYGLITLSGSILLPFDYNQIIPMTSLGDKYFSYSVKSPEQCQLIFITKEGKVQKTENKDSQYCQIN